MWTKQTMLLKKILLDLKMWVHSSHTLDIESNLFAHRSLTRKLSVQHVGRELLLVGTKRRFLILKRRMIRMRTQVTFQSFEGQRYMISQQQWLTCWALEVWPLLLQVERMISWNIQSLIRTKRRVQRERTVMTTTQRNQRNQLRRRKKRRRKKRRRKRCGKPLASLRLANFWHMLLPAQEAKGREGCSWEAWKEEEEGQER